MGRIELQELSARAPAKFDKKETEEETEKILEELNDLQNLLYAENKHSILFVIQGMDASGKDGVIRNVFTSMNPQGVKVKSFKAPTAEELSHDFLWRIHPHAPATGMVQIFNRSHYEDIIVTRVHNWCSDETAYKRMDAINNFERLLTRHNNTTILKVYLHTSAEEQKERLDERMSNPAKMWKYNENDYEEAKLREKYLEMYEDCFEHCNEIPWVIVPSDQNWYKEFIVASLLRETMKNFKMEYPGIKNKPTI